MSFLKHAPSTMKSHATTLFASVALLAFTIGTASAQIQASYPLSTDLLDATGNYTPVSTFGNTTGPTDGVCVGGVYGAPNSGDELYTPSISAFNELDFQIDVDFNITAFSTSGRRSVLIGSRGWRFIGIEVDPAGQVGILYNNASWLPSTATVNVGEWNWATLKFDNGAVELLINGVSVVTGNIGLLNTNSDYRFTTTNYSNGGVLDGCVRNLVISNDATIGTADASTANYGTGCNNLSLTANGVPTLGNALFAFDVVGPAPLLPLAYMAFGNGIVDPGLDLTFIGMPGCFAYTDLTAGIVGPVVLAPGSGAGSLPFPLPNTPALAGALLSAQAIGFALTQLVSSNGTRIYLGL